MKGKERERGYHLLKSRKNLSLNTNVSVVGGHSTFSENSRCFYLSYKYSSYRFCFREISSLDSTHLPCFFSGKK